MRRFRQNYRHDATFLVRPGEARARVRVDTAADTMAAAATAAAQCRVPVDVAVWVCAEALIAAVGEVVQAASVVATSPSDAGRPLDPATTEWVRMLRFGCGWVEDTLPSVLVPLRLGLHDGDRRLASATNLAADTARLRIVLDAESASARSGRTLTAAMTM